MRLPRLTLIYKLCEKKRKILFELSSKTHLYIFSSIIDYRLNEIDEENNAEQLVAQNCDKNAPHLAFTTSSPGLISLNLDLDSNNETRTKTTNASTSLTNCQFPFRTFTRLNAHTNRLVIDYDPAANLAFLLTFTVYRPVDVATPPPKKEDLKCDFENNEMECESQFSLAGQNFTQTSCIDKDLICNCLLLYPLDASSATTTTTKPTPSAKSRTDISPFLQQQHNSVHRMDSCDYLIESFENYLLSLQQSRRTLCSYYLNMNRRCLSRAVSEEDAANPEKLMYLKNLNDMSGISLVENEGDEDDDQYESNLANSSPISANNVAESAIPAASSGRSVVGLTPAEIAKYCTNVFRTNEFGWLASPNMYVTGDGSSDSMYPLNLNCSYHIIMQPYQSVQLRFKYFSLRQTNVSGNGNNNNNNNNNNASLQMTGDAASSSSDDYDSLSIYDGPSSASPLIIRLTSLHNDFSRFLASRAFTSKSNIVLVVFHSAAANISRRPAAAKGDAAAAFREKVAGFNFTYQIKGYCIEDQRSCNMLYETNCYSLAQVCNDVWDCANGADERGCEPCKADQFKCRNHIFCFRAEERCDGDHHCTDKSDELNCDKWQCNSDNGTFLCANGRCIYEQWACDGTVDCEDGSDEAYCPSTFSTRRVITTAVLGGTLCCLLLVMALGCACKLYTLHTVSYRSSLRLTQAAGSSSSTQPLIASSSSNNSNMSSLLPTTALPPPFGATDSGNSTATSTTNRPTRHNRSNRNSSRVQTLIRGFMRRSSRHQRQSSLNLSVSASGSNSAAASNNPSGVNPTSASPPPPLPASSSVNTSNLLDFTTSDLGGMSSVVGEIPLPPPHHLIAPPTYNQTMGLVDEYEQRQLAFLEHVRSILSQQQHQHHSGGAGSGGTPPPGLSASSTNGQLASLNLMIPTVAASSSTTVVRRVTSNGTGAGGGRRSHSTRHGHRHHRERGSGTDHHHGSHHHGSGSGHHRSGGHRERDRVDREMHQSSSGGVRSTGGGGGVPDQALLGMAGLPSTMIIDSSSAQNQQHLRSSNTAASSGSNGATASAVGSSSTSSSSRHHRHHRHNRHVNGSGSASSSSAGQFDANRRGLQLPSADSNNNHTNNNSTSREHGGSSSTSSRHRSTHQQQPTIQLMPIPLLTGNGVVSMVPSTSANTSASIDSTNPSTSSTNGQSSANLRDKIARLIKDIVVHNHHGNNSIHYEQLTGQQPVNSPPLNSLLGGGQPSAAAFVSTRVDETNPNLNRRATTASTNTQGSSSSGGGGNGTNNEDDVPLLLP